MPHKTNNNPSVGFIDRLKVAAVRHSWRLQNLLQMSVIRHHGSQAIVVPIVRGQGLHLLEPVYADLSVTLQTVLQFRPGPVVDVGANVGAFLMALLEIDRRIPYVAFEPDSSCCNYLDTLVALNCLASHSVFPVALSDKPGVLSLQFNSAADVSATVVQGFRPAKMYAREKEVLSMVGDDILSTYFNADSARISVIKIDAEGAENLVLRGLERTIDSHRPCLILEVTPYQHFLDFTLDESYFGQVSREEALRIGLWRQDLIRQLDEFLSSHRYTIFRIRETGQLTPVDSVDPGKTKSLLELNYLAVPAEEDQRFRNVAETD